MTNRWKVQGPATPEEVESAYRKSYERYERERLLALQIAQRGGRTLAEIAELVGRGRATVARWIKA